jgi:hypothetical protein
LEIGTQPDSVCDEICEQAEPYLDTRQNKVHTSLSYDFARRLLAPYPDADKLWRFTPAGVDIDHTRFRIERDRFIKWLDTVMADWFFTPKARQMAHTAPSEAKCSSGTKEN